MKILITGIAGMVGGFLAREILNQGGAEVYGTYRWRSRMENVEAIRERLHLRECDVRDGSSVRKLISEVRPDRVYHLAAQSNVRTSMLAPADTLSTNVVGLVNMLEAIRDLQPAARVLVPGSSEEYGQQEPHELPIRETNFLRPLSPYGVSKVAQDMAGLQYSESYKLHIVRTRAFNHTGPGREEDFVESNFARQIAEIEAGLRPPRVETGNLDVVRDYSDARDVVRAYLLALEHGTPGEVYNVCSGRGRRIGEILDTLLSFTDARVEIVQELSRVRVHEPLALVGDPSRFHGATGWEPRIPFEQTLREILEYWRGRVRTAARVAPSGA